jgi:rfaE bifunctional protein nucleotidyltransferase chain/domain
MHSGVYSLNEIYLQIAASPANWRPLVFTNGCFDLLHAGHVRYLQAAKAMGRSLVVGLNSDHSVRMIKPAQAWLPQRPVIPEAQRAEILAALKPVDGVVIFAEPTAMNLIATLQPEIYVKGHGYTVETLPEAPTVQAYGGQIKLIETEVPTSSTQILNQIVQNCLQPAV